ncbi:hypothetical protein [Streptomyces carminius]|uniref:hypothetical protein n=1 Tax=Streptomyces carminius TaxID=2665496 RepID=UPI0018EA84F9|nr:hypothetical protein [Streptomyces carminius]
MESTGVLTDAEEARTHPDAGARKVIIPAPGKNADLTLAHGVNDGDYDPASCVFDSLLTQVTGGGRHVKVFGRYDNESGFAHRVLDVARLVGAPAPA